MLGGVPIRGVKGELLDKASQSPKPITFSAIPNIFLNIYPKTYEPALFRDKGGGFYI